LKQLSTTSEGWDGNHNGTPLPSTDYWFQVFYKFNGTDQEFKAHFSLKR
jgi:gliding motility-associated-like protein